VLEPIDVGVSIWLVGDCDTGDAIRDGTGDQSLIIFSGVEKLVRLAQLSGEARHPKGRINGWLETVEERRGSIFGCGALFASGTLTML